MKTELGDLVDICARMDVVTVTPEHQKVEDDQKVEVACGGCVVQGLHYRWKGERQAPTGVIAVCGLSPKEESDVG